MPKLPVKLNLKSEPKLKIKRTKIESRVTEFTHVIHLADVHIPLKLQHDRKEEFEIVFQRLYQNLRELAKTRSLVVVIPGDLLQVKLKLEPETIILARDFLSNLSAIAPTLLVTGNHDCNEANLEQTDALTAICHQLDVHYLKLSGLYDIGNLTFAVSSLLDQIFIRRKDFTLNSGRKCFKLYHGAIVGAKTDTNHLIAQKQNSSSSRYRAIEDFEGYDGVMLGDIHKYQHINDKIAYCGSLLQQNYGEQVENHGFLIWDVQTGKQEFVHIENDYAFINLRIRQGQIDPKDQELLDKYSNKLLRLKYKLYNTNITEVKILSDEIKTRYNVVSVKTEIVKPFIEHSILNEDGNEHATIGFDQEVGLIRKYADPKLCDQVINLHRTLSQSVEYQSNYWNIVNMEFQNIMIYGHDYVNSIDFENGVHNICAPNTAGKSSIANIILFTLFDKICANASDRSSIIHSGASQGWIKLRFICNEKLYLVHKTCKKRIKNNKETSTYLTKFYQIVQINPEIKIDLTETQKIQTLNAIHAFIGDFGIFTTHHIISTKLHNSIIDLKPAERLKHFHKLCSTAKYEDYHTQCKTKVTGFKNNLTYLHGQISQIQSNLDRSETNLSKDELNLKKNELVETQNKLIIEKKKYIEQKNELLENKGELQARTEEQLPPEDSKSNLERDLVSFKKTLEGLDPDGKVRQLGGQVQDLSKQIIKLKQGIVPLEESVDFIKDKIIDLNDQITEHKKTRPNRDYDYLVGQKAVHKQKIIDLSLKLKDIGEVAELEEHNEEYSHEDASIEDLCFQRNRLHDEIKKLGKVNIQDIEVEIQKCKRELDQIGLAQIDPEMIDQLPIIKHKIKQLRIEQRKLGTISLSSSQIDESGTDNIDDLKKQIRPVHEKKHFDNRLYQQLLKKLENDSLSLTIEYLKNLDHCDIDGPDNQPLVMALIHPERVDQLIKLLQDGDLHKERVELMKLEQIIEFNQKCDEDKAHNHLIKSKINYLEHKRITTELKSLQETHKKINEFKSQQLTKLHIEQLEGIINSIKFLDVISYRISYLISGQIGSLKDNLDRIVKALDWYKEDDDLKSELHDWKQLLDVDRQNRQNREQIMELDHRRQVLETYNTIKLIEEDILIWDQIEENRKIYVQISLIQSQIADIDRDLDRIEDHESSNRRLITEIDQKLIDVERHNKLLKEKTETVRKAREVELELKTYSEYTRLFNRNEIPFQILQLKLGNFSELVNEIFEKHTRYSFKHDRSDNGKLVFHVFNKKNNCLMEMERLSGFETFILNIAINQASFNIANRFRCGFLIVDESLDCIDPRRFTEKLPDIIETIKHYYQKVLLISHREIADDIVDKQLKINCFDTYSTIGHK